MTYVLGLTGGIASGKSTVSFFLKNQGAVIIDGDVVAREVVKKNSLGLKQIIEKFGEEFITNTGELNRRRLGDLVFNDKDSLKKLTSITGPLIHKRVRKLIEDEKNRKSRLIVLDIPLLFEGNYQQYCDNVMCVCVPEKIQIKRLMKRDHFSEQQARNRILSQMESVKRCALADILIDNSKQVEETLNQVLKWLEIMDLG